MVSIYRITLSFFLALSLMTSAFAVSKGENGATASDTDIEKVRENIKQNFPPKFVVEKISPTPVPGIFEVLATDGKFYYVDQTGQYSFSPPLIDVKNKKNLTKAPERIIDFSTLPLEKAVKIGKGERKIAVFTDPDCPYCRKLHTELNKLTDIEVYVFLYPLPMHPEAKGKSISIWCSDDQASVLDKVMDGGKPDAAVCDNPVEDIIQLGQKLRITGTPGMILDNGKFIPGLLPTDGIKEALKEPVKEKAK